MGTLVSGREIRTFYGHTDGVNSCEFSPDGKYIVSASSDATIRIWDLSIKDYVKTDIATHSRKSNLPKENLPDPALIATIKLLWIVSHIAFHPTKPWTIITANKNCTLTSFDISQYFKI